MEPFDLCGGHLALDFANTVDGRYQERQRDRLDSYAQLVRFAEFSEVLPPEQAQRYLDRARATPGEAERVTDEARQLRDALYELFSAVAAGEDPPEDALAELDRWNGRLRLGPGLRWSWRAGDEALDAPMRDIVVSAVELLMNDQLQRVGLCQSDTCRWVFLDTSRNHSRRWCDMSVCGNRAKAKRFRTR